MPKTAAPAIAPAIILAAALALPLAAPAVAATVLVEVEAQAHSSTPGFGLATGILVNAGSALSIYADPRDVWSLGSEEPCTRTSDADGLVPDCYGTYTQGNLTARYGTLVGRIGSGDFFVVGSVFEGTATGSGELFLYAWDSNDFDNTGAITVSVSAVPLPAAGLMLAGALGGLTLLRRRKARA